MATNRGEAVKRFVKTLDLSQVLPGNQWNKKYHILLGGPQMSTVQDVVQKLSTLFNIQNIVLTSGDAALPELENLQILTFFDDIKVKFKSSTPNSSNGLESTQRLPARKSHTQSALDNSIGHLLNSIRATVPDLPGGSTQELSDTQPIENSSSSDAPDREEGNDLNVPKPKRRRVRRHKRKSQPTLNQSTDGQNGTEIIEQVDEGQKLLELTPFTLRQIDIRSLGTGPRIIKTE